MNRLTYILMIIAFIGCKNNSKQIDRIMLQDDCEMTYSLNELYFEGDDTLNIDTRIVIIKASKKDILKCSDQSIKDAIAKANAIYAQARIRFVVKSIKEVVNKEAATDIEGFRSNTLRYQKEHCINIFIYPDVNNARFSGAAAGIPSTVLAIEDSYVMKTTLPHELGHCLGLYHTHESDPASNGYNSESGDFICDTPKSDLYANKIDTSCAYVGSSILSPSEINLLVCNIMSYSFYECRFCITDNQIKRIKWVIENSQDLRSSVHLQ